MIMTTELNFIDYIGFFAIIFLFVYTVVMSSVYKKRRKALLIKNGYVKRTFPPTYIEMTGKTLLEGLKSLIRIVKIHLDEKTSFDISEELRMFQIILNAQQPMLTTEKQIQKFSGWAFIITFITALFGNIPPHWNFVASLFILFHATKEYFNLKKYAVTHIKF